MKFWAAIALILLAFVASNAYASEEELESEGENLVEAEERRDLAGNNTCLYKLKTLTKYTFKPYARNIQVWRDRKDASLTTGPGPSKFLLNSLPDGLQPSCMVKKPKYVLPYFLPAAKSITRYVGACIATGKSDGSTEGVTVAVFDCHGNELYCGDFFSGPDKLTIGAAQKDLLVVLGSPTTAFNPHQYGFFWRIRQINSVWCDYWDSNASY